MVSAEKKRKFRGQCKQIVLDILLKFSERSPLWYTILRCTSCLSPANMVNSPKEWSQRFTILADCLFALKKISASVVDNSKYQFDQFLKVAQYERKEEFLKFSFKKGRLDVFFGPFLAENDSYNNVWAICKIVFMLSHGQSFTERGFSINREDSPLTMICRKSLWYRKGLLNYTSFEEKLSLSYKRYKLELRKNAEEKASNSADLKRKIEHDEIQKVKNKRWI